MSFVTKYSIQWMSFEGVACRVEIGYPDYDGDVISLTPSANPFQLTEYDSDDPFTPVRGLTGSVGITITNSSDISLLSDIIPDEYNMALVVAYRDSEVSWMGFVSPQAFTQPWVQTPFSVDIPVYDFVQALYYARIPTSMRSTVFNFGALFARAIEDIFGDELQAFTVYIESDFSENNTYDCFMRYHLPTSFYFDEVNSDTDATTNYDGMSYGEAFEYILQPFGMCLRNGGGCIYYFQLMYATRGQEVGAYVYTSRALTIEDIYNIGTGHITDLGFAWNQTTESVTDADVVRADGSISINQSVSGVKVVFSIDALSDVHYLSIPDHEDETATAKEWPAITLRPLQLYPDNTQGYVAQCLMKASTYEETDPSSADYGYKYVTITSFFSSSSDRQTLFQYCSLYPGSYPNIPAPGASEMSTYTVVGGIMCQYMLPDESEFSIGVFVSAGINSLTSQSNAIPRVFTIYTPAQTTINDGYVKVKISGYTFQNYPFANDRTRFSLVSLPKYIRIALSVGNYRYNGSTSLPWTAASSEIIVKIDPSQELLIPVATQMSGVIRITIYGLFEGEDYDLQDQTFGYSNIFTLFTGIDVSYTPNSSETTTNNRTENRYFEPASGHGDNREVLLSIGSNQNNRKANNILYDAAGNLVSTITYNDGIERHPERHLAKRAAVYYNAKQAIYEFTTGLRDFAPTSQVLYRSSPCAVVRKRVEWSYDTSTLKLLPQKD